MNAPSHTVGHMAIRKGDVHNASIGLRGRRSGDRHRPVRSPALEDSVRQRPLLCGSAAVPRLGVGPRRRSPLTRKMVLFGSLLFVGLTAGAAYVIWFDYDPSGMSPAFFAETMQHAIRALTVPLPTIVVLGLLFTVIASFQARSDRAPFLLLTVASLCIICVALITRFGNIPINNQILTWNIASPPVDWARVAEKWWRLQTARVVLQTVALCLVSSAVLIRMSAKGSRPI